MSGKKKSGHKKPTLEKLLLATAIVLLTAILNLAKALIDLISKLTE